jgi:hypothetical protein
MFPVEGRMLGVFAALGVAFATVILGGWLSEVEDRAEPDTLPAFIAATATRASAVNPDGELALNLGETNRGESAYGLQDRLGLRSQLCRDKRLLKRAQVHGNDCFTEISAAGPNLHLAGSGQLHAIAAPPHRSPGAHLSVSRPPGPCCAPVGY